MLGKKRFNFHRRFGELDELPIVPLLAAEGEFPPERQMWRMQSIVVRERELRERIEAELQRMLDDKRPVSIPVTGGREEERRPPPRRVCDEAYMQLRLLVNADPDEEYLQKHPEPHLK